ncbi:MAG: hypothetical protein AMXMBFR64_38000 [Myxococcales bacterium]
MILVTDRDEVVVEISTPRTVVSGRVSRWEAFVNDEELRGRLTRARQGRSLALDLLQQQPLEAPPVDLLLALESAREERS